MPTYISIDETGAITAQADWKFPGSEGVNYDVVRGCDGKLYKSGEEPQGPTPEEQLLLQLRSMRDAKLADTDKYLMPDYPISPEKIEEIKAYRQILRDLPAQPGAPWDGGGELTPWPELPKTEQDEGPASEETPTDTSEVKE